jgi:hypothetical protein
MDDMINIETSNSVGISLSNYITFFIAKKSKNK